MMMRNAARPVSPAARASIRATARRRDITRTEP
jgi:hypothetical protein